MLLNRRTSERGKGKITWEYGIPFVCWACLRKRVRSVGKAGGGTHICPIIANLFHFSAEDLVPDHG